MNDEELARKHILDQASAQIIDEIPSFLANFYRKLVEEGFDDIQAMHLVTEYMKSLLDGK